MTLLYKGIAAEWYKDRLRHMYKVRPKCPLLFSMNHLLGNCPTCGLGRYKASKRFQITQLSIDRVYTFMVRPNIEQHLLYARRRWPSLQTNVEFPLPIIRYHTSVHIPMFVDPVSNTVIDFLTESKTMWRLIRAVDKMLNASGYKYVVFVGTKEVHRSASSRIEEAKALQLMNALREVLVDGGVF